MGDGSSGQDGPGEPVARLRSRSIDAVAQRVELLVRELDRGGGEVVLQVLDAGCSRDGEDHRRRFNNQARASWGGVASSSLLSSSSGPPGGARHECPWRRAALGADLPVSRKQPRSRAAIKGQERQATPARGRGAGGRDPRPAVEDNPGPAATPTTGVRLDRVGGGSGDRHIRSCSRQFRRAAERGERRREAARNRPVRHLASDQAQRDLRPLVPRGERGSLEGLTEEGRRSWTSWWCTNRATATPI